LIQVGAGATGASVTALPRGVSPLAMFRCHAHVLVIGARRSGRDEQAVIVPVAVRRGRFAAAAAAAAAARATTGCSAR
jgi:hypothetical protein